MLDARRLQSANAKNVRSSAEMPAPRVSNKAHTPICAIKAFSNAMAPHTGPITQGVSAPFPAPARVRLDTHKRAVPIQVMHGSGIPEQAAALIHARLHMDTLFTLAIQQGNFNFGATICAFAATVISSICLAADTPETTSTPVLAHTNAMLQTTVPTIVTPSPRSTHSTVPTTDTPLTLWPRKSTQDTKDPKISVVQKRLLEAAIKRASQRRSNGHGSAFTAAAAVAAGTLTWNQTATTHFHGPSTLTKKKNKIAHLPTAERVRELEAREEELMNKAAALQAQAQMLAECLTEVTHQMSDMEDRASKAELATRLQADAHTDAREQLLQMELRALRAERAAQQLFERGAGVTASAGFSNMVVENAVDVVTAGGTEETLRKQLQMAKMKIKHDQAIIKGLNAKLSKCEGAASTTRGSGSQKKGR